MNVSLSERKGVADGGASGAGEVAGLQRRVGLIDHLELLLRRLVPAVGIGMVALHELLVAGLDASEGERRRELEYRQGLLLRRERSFALPRLRGGVVDVEQPVVAPARLEARAETTARAARSAAARRYRSGSPPRSPPRSSRHSNSRPHYRRGRDRDKTSRRHRVRTSSAARGNRRPPRNRDGRMASARGFPRNEPSIRSKKTAFSQYGEAPEARQADERSAALPVAGRSP